MQCIDFGQSHLSGAVHIPDGLVAMPHIAVASSKCSIMCVLHSPPATPSLEAAAVPCVRVPSVDNESVSDLKTQLEMPMAGDRLALQSAKRPYHVL